MPEILNILDDSEVIIPAWVTDNASFLRWAESDDAPEKGRYGFLQNQLWIDQTMETVFHNNIKTIIAAMLTQWSVDQNLGDYFSDGMLLSVPDLEFTTQPDGMFVSHATWKSDRAYLKQKEESVVVYGSPDMVLEVVSRSTKRKDLEVLRELYFEAGITEYWVVDSREKQPTLQILRRNSRGFKVTPHSAGWVKSIVFGASFQLVTTTSGIHRRVRLERK
jgi:Uma2 family endonuclease